MVEIGLLCIIELINKLVYTGKPDQDLPIPRAYPFWKTLKHKGKTAIKESEIFNSHNPLVVISDMAAITKTPETLRFADHFFCLCPSLKISDTFPILFRASLRTAIFTIFGVFYVTIWLFLFL